MRSVNYELNPANKKARSGGSERNHQHRSEIPCIPLRCKQSLRCSSDSQSHESAPPGHSRLRHDTRSTTLTAQHLVSHLDIRGRLRNVSKRMSEQSQGLDRQRFLLVCLVVNVVVSLLGLLNRSIKNVVNIVTFCGGVNSVDVLLSINGCM